MQHGIHVEAEIMAALAQEITVEIDPRDQHPTYTHQVQQLKHTTLSGGKVVLQLLLVTNMRL